MLEIERRELRCIMLLPPGHIRDDDDFDNSCDRGDDDDDNVGDDDANIGDNEEFSTQEEWTSLQGDGTGLIDHNDDLPYGHH